MQQEQSLISRLKASLKFLMIYTCHSCSKQANGDTQREDFDGHSSCEIKNFLDSKTLQANYMPVGWSSHYDPKRTIFKCSECTKKECKRDG